MLWHYTCAFSVRFQKDGKEEDLRRKISAIRGVLRLSPDQGLEEETQADLKKLLARHLLERLKRFHLNDLTYSDMKDIVEISNLLHGLLAINPSDTESKVLMLDALNAKSCFFANLKQATPAGQNVPSSLMLEILKGELDSNAEAVRLVFDVGCSGRTGDDEFSCK